jgi:hypothetical protein
MAKSVQMMRSVLRLHGLSRCVNVQARHAQRIPWTPAGRLQFNAARYAARYLKRHGAER